MQSAILPAIVSLVLFASVGASQDRNSDLRRSAPEAGSRRPVAPRLGGESIFGVERYAVKQEGRFQLPALEVPTTDITGIGNGVLPENFADSPDEPILPIPEGPDRSGAWSISAYLWQAPNTFAYPRYFEDVMLERHGHERFPALQPLISGGRFFATFPMLPYLATIRPPCETEYTLGYYRPGARAPALLQRPPYQGNAAWVEFATVAGAIVAFP